MKRWTESVATLLRQILWIMPGALLAAVAAWSMLTFDAVFDVPYTISTENARVLLGATFSAVIMVGAFAFWMRPITAQLAASSMPPRRVAAHLHDRFQQRVIATTVAATAYLAIIMLSLPDGPDGLAPAIATVSGAALGVGAMASLLVAIREAESTTRPAFLVAETARAVIEMIGRSGYDGDGSVENQVPPDDGPKGHTITAPETGWIQSIDGVGLRRSAPAKSHVRLEAGLGGFVVAGSTSICAVKHQTPTEEDERRMQEHFRIADVRPAEVDLVGSLTEFTDVAVHTLGADNKSISTMYETMGYLGTVLHQLVDNDLQTEDLHLDDGRVLHQGPGPDGAGLAQLCIDRIRQAGAGEPVVALEMVRILLEVKPAASARGRRDIERVLDNEADLVVAQCKHAGGFPPDVERVAAARAGGPAPQLTSVRRHA